MEGAKEVMIKDNKGPGKKQKTEDSPRECPVDFASISQCEKL